MVERNSLLPGRIERLDNLTVNQIAAGEVIERPVSVVKELIENAIDAGSRTIRIEIGDGGLALIRVADDGQGIDNQDLVLAVERHATSKLRLIQDLEDLRTLGFRGEALASIASVASLEIETRRKGEILGYRLRVAGEDAQPVVSKAGCPEGTQVAVEHLFFNTPARLKFMKSAGYEGGLIHDLVIQMALGYPHVGFRLENQGKLLVDTFEIHQMEDLVELFYGKEARQALVPVEASVSKGRLSGWVSAPPYSRGTRKGYHLFVNGRRVVAKDMQWAMEKAFEYLLPRGRFPLCILHFKLPGDLLDVNIHPGKLEIRINDPQLHPSLTRALREAVSGGQRMPEIGGYSEAEAVRGSAGVSRGGSHAAPVAQEAVRQWDSIFSLTDDGEKALDSLLREDGIREDGIRGDGFREEAASYDLPEDSVLLRAGDQASAVPQDQWGVETHTRSIRALAAGEQPGDFFFGPQVSFTVIGQLHATFILAELKAGLLLADQHVVHERVLYEEMAEKAGEKQNAQMLMQPLSIQLTASEEETMIQKILLLHDLGLIFERFGPRQYLLRGEPPGCSMDQRMVRELLEILGTEGEGKSIEETKQALLVMNACKAAVKANTILNLAEMTLLLKKLQQTAHPMTCPHGRPILYLLPYPRLIRAFGRAT